VTEASKHCGETIALWLIYLHYHGRHSAIVVK